MLRALLQREKYLSAYQANEASSQARRQLPTTVREWCSLLATRPTHAYACLTLIRMSRIVRRRRKRHNHRFMERELVRHAGLLDDIDGRTLEPDQRRAVVSNEDNELVVAGAGSGKTLTIVAKVRYLVQAYGVDPSAIMPVSFTAASANSLGARIHVPGVHSTTFHAFGLAVIRSVEARLPPIFDDTQLNRLIGRWTHHLIGRPDAAYRHLMCEYLEISGSAGSTSARISDEQIAPFIQLCREALPLVRASGTTISELRERLRSQQSSWRKAGRTYERTDQFLRLFTPVLSLYVRYLKATGHIDFHEMINRASEYIADGRYRCELDYVIIDEFQDLSFDRYRLLTAIRQQRPGVRFFCVGDDWQSIYRFAGSDIGLFRDFAHHFGPTAISRIGTTYRFNQPMIGISSAFITKNPNQMPKDLRAPAGRPPTTCAIIAEGTRTDDSSAFLQAMRSLESNYGLHENSHMYAIGRFGFDYQRVTPQAGILERTTGADGQPAYIYHLNDGLSLTIPFITAHRAKGLEADFCIVLNANRGRFGFPADQPEDPVLSLLLSSADTYEHGEERRLFYVAMTRAKRHTVFICDPERPSPFVREIDAYLRDGSVY